MHRRITHTNTGLTGKANVSLQRLARGKGSKYFFVRQISAEVEHELRFTHIHMPSNATHHSVCLTSVEEAGATTRSIWPFFFVCMVGSRVTDASDGQKYTLSPACAREIACAQQQRRGAQERAQPTRIDTAPGPSWTGGGRLAFLETKKRRFFTAPSLVTLIDAMDRERDRVCCF